MSDFLHTLDGPPEGPKKRHWLRYTLLGIVVFVVALIAVGVALGGSNPKPGVTTNPISSYGSQVSEQPAQASQAPAAAPTPAPAAATTPALTTSEQQAVESAQSYLSNLGGFSEYGLLQQLTSSEGAGFSTADAQFAISYLHPDWYQQAVQSARSYMSNVGGFSAAGLYQQLTSPDGGGFTPGQANYALKQVGL
jgi:hypothetical protein